MKKQTRKKKEIKAKQKESEIERMKERFTKEDK